MRYIVGCDIGTTSVKAVSFSLEGAILGSESIAYPMLHPAPAYAEQDPDEIFRHTVTVLKKLIAGHDKSPVAVVFSSAMHSLMALDEHGVPGSSLIIWADNRSGDLADRLRNSAGGKAQYLRTGIPVHAMTPACKLLWVNLHKPDGLYRASRYLGIKDYVILRLTGRLVTDYSMAAAMGLLNIRTLEWDEETLTGLEITPGQLPEIVSPYFSAPVTREWEILKDIPVIAGGSDGCLANLGSGAGGPGTLALTIGTSGAVRKTFKEVHLDLQMRTFCYPLDRDIMIVGGPTNNGGVVFQWLKDTFFADLTFEQMLEGAAAIAPGSEGLTFFPYLMGERAPLWDSAVRGNFHGIDIGHTRFHFARAVMEGILMNLYTIAGVLLEKEEAHILYANGGFAQSRVFVQMLADIFGMDVALNATNDAGCIGAALVGLRALGEIPDFSNVENFVKVAEIVKFNADVHAAYREVFDRFGKLLKTIPL
ncbi:gluconokinase [Ravibacter arvi]|uniref:Gluconokinase n=1 Tax=Ravibacter arvi TaxID=2051041 RepID=A0ABP8MEB7_9BACT